MHFQSRAKQIRSLHNQQHLRSIYAHKLGLLMNRLEENSLDPDILPDRPPYRFNATGADLSAAVMYDCMLAYISTVGAFSSTFPRRPRVGICQYRAFQQRKQLFSHRGQDKVASQGCYLVATIAAPEGSQRMTFASFCSSQEEDRSSSCGEIRIQGEWAKAGCVSNAHSRFQASLATPEDNAWQSHRNAVPVGVCNRLRVRDRSRSHPSRAAVPKKQGRRKGAQRARIPGST